MSIAFIGQTGLPYRPDRVSLPGTCPFLPFESGIEVVPAIEFSTRDEPEKHFLDQHLSVHTLAIAPNKT